ncbi:hypothetical protein FOC4_g10009183 [Fusarium odoratissimum]|uniref:Oxidoreductase n=1 Tax=Fusarium oxysporum f. sp. cubense (strain race 4) TaxID=2502994 RepID=N1S7Y7_FUSC4|nr:hypothetical protein FOC4_g10009183 [Fusarium odoratissimum]
MDTRTEVSDVTEASSRPRIAQLPASCDPPQPNTPVKQLVWVIFGGTGQMGHSLVKCALSHGDLVTSVGRVFETSLKDMENIHENCLGALCDVRARESVNRVIERTLQRFGRIDIVVNCSGYGVIGACEDQDEHDIRNQFETNFMGTLHIIHATLPYFRRQNAGRYLIFSSTSGALGVPGLGPYCATKYAVEGLIEAMLYETDAFNIKATLIEPGHYVHAMRLFKEDPKWTPLNRGPDVDKNEHRQEYVKQFLVEGAKYQENDRITSPTEEPPNMNIAG